MPCTLDHLGARNREPSGGRSLLPVWLLDGSGSSAETLCAVGLVRINPVTLKKRSEFLRIRGGARSSTASFVLETKLRAEPDAAAGSGPRFGFTVTKQLGSAVTRNRIRRRLKAAVALAAASQARPGYDYVLIARSPALDRPFAELKKELEDALHRVHHAPRRHSKPRR